MKLVTRNTDYGVRSICYIAKAKGRVVTVAELCQQLKIARPFLRVILQKLHHKAILNAAKGRKGGFTLNKKSSTISLLDIMCIFQGEEGFLHCRTLGKKCDNMPVCPLRRRLKKLETDFFAELSKITIKSLIDEI